MSTPPQFIPKLWKILNKPKYNSILSWDKQDGIGFTIHDSQALADVVLGQYFRSNKLSSFKRQLNYFGFQKAKTTKNTDRYVHLDFHPAHSENLHLILRKTNTGGKKRKNKQDDTVDKKTIKK